MKIRLGAALLLFCISASSQQPAKTTVLKAAQLFDGRSDAPITEAVVVIEGNKITQVGSKLPIPSGATVIDLGDSLLLPGYIDCHTHLLQNYDPGLRGEDDVMLLTVAQMTTAKRALLGVKMGMQDLEAGITTVRDLGNSGMEGDIALRDAINDGWVQGPRIAASTRALSAPGGQFGVLTPAAEQLVDEEYAVIKSPDDARRAVQHAVYAGADQIKVIVNARATITADEMKAIVEEAHRLHLKVAAHAIGDDATRIAAEAGVDSIEHAYRVPDDVLKMMAVKHIYLVPTDGTAETYHDLFAPSRNQWVHDNADTMAREEASHRIERTKRAMSFGVPIAAGSDMYYQLGSKTRGEASLLMLQAYLDAGMPPIQVVKVATRNAAELIGWQDQIGSIEKGKLADIIAVPRDALQRGSDLLKVGFVMKDGTIYRNYGAIQKPRSEQP
jgi:imidazolonepropionase-like amidohydrolase